MQNKLLRYLVCISLAVVFCTGCASSAVQNMNNAIGKSVNEVIRPAYESQFHREKIDEHTYELQWNDSNGNCSIAFTVRCEDDIITAWRYINNLVSSNCEKFATGP